MDLQPNFSSGDILGLLKSPSDLVLGAVEVLATILSCAILLFGLQNTDSNR